jgi:hypothetical protein
VKSAEIFGDHVGRDGRAGADAKRSAVETAQRAQFILGRVLGREQRFGMARQRLALTGRAHALRRAVKEATSDLQLEIPHALGDRRLADMQEVRGTGETPCPDHGREQAEQMQV